MQKITWMQINQSARKPGYTRLMIADWFIEELIQENQ